MIDADFYNRAMPIQRLMHVMPATQPGGGSLRLATALVLTLAALLALLLLIVAALTLGRRLRGRPVTGRPKPPTPDPWTESARRIYVDQPRSSSPPDPTEPGP